MGIARRIAPALLLALAAPAGAAPFEVSADGQEVTDAATRLVWRRCAEGMQWDGTTCSGTPQKYTFDQAARQAQAQAGADKKAWRVPTLKELMSLVEGGRGSPPVPREAFPETPAKPFWSSSPYTQDGIRGSYVHFSNGGEYFDYRSNAYHLRLVRSK